MEESAVKIQMRMEFVTTSMIALEFTTSAASVTVQEKFTSVDVQIFLMESVTAMETSSML